MTTRNSAAASKALKTSDNKTDIVIALLKGKDGASLAELATATHWQHHSARAVLTGLRKKGYIIGKLKIDGVTRWTIARDSSV